MVDQVRDPQTKIDWSRIERFGPGPVRGSLDQVMMVNISVIILLPTLLMKLVWVFVDINSEHLYRGVLQMLMSYHLKMNQKDRIYDFECRIGPLS